MKNLLKYFLSILLTAIVFASCSQLIESHEEKTTSSNSGNISVVLGGGNSEARTALPSESTDDYKKFTDIVLCGSKSGELTELASWEAYSNIAIDEKSIDLESGTWTFKLTAKRFGVLFSQTLSNVSVTSGSTTTLNFSAMSVDASNTGTLGAISAKIGLYYSSVGNKSNVLYIAAKIDDGELSKKTSLVLSSNGACSTYTYDAENVEEGNHLITFYVYENCTYDSAVKDCTGGNLILTLPFYANVIPGYTSTMEEWLGGNTVSADESVTSKTVTYKANYPSGTAPDDYEQEYFTGSSILDAAALEFKYSADGKRFAYWTTDSEGNGTKYYAGDLAEITEDITLYAQWKVFYNVIYQSNPFVYSYGNTYWDDSYYVQQYESGSSLKASDKVYFADETSNYKFCGWDTKADGTGTRYAPNDTPTFSEDTMLYAQWCSYQSKSSETYELSSVREFVALFKAPASIVDAFSATIYLASGFSGADITSYTSAKTFSGTFYGKNYTISGITKPLFSTVSGTVENVKLASSTISGSGAIAQTVTSDGKINYCTVASTVTLNGTSGDEFVGGIAGTNAGTISNCTMNGKASSTKLGASVGGICGKNTGTVTSPTVSGATITSENAYRVAGVAGYNTSSVAIASATIKSTTITGGEYAYINENYVGISGSSSNTTKSGNTVTGYSNIVYPLQSYSHSAGTTQSYKFTTANRESTANVYMKITNGYTWPSIYQDGSSTALLSVATRLNDNNVLNENVTLPSTSSANSYTFKIKNENVIEKATGSFSIELE